MTLLRKLLQKLRLYFKKVPILIDNKEKIVNIVFSPLNFRSDNTLKGNAYKCKRGRDDLSVNRLNFTTLDFCKKQGIVLEKNAVIKDKKFFGIALLFAKEIRLLANVFCKPVPKNKSHAEIVTGYILEAGEVAPAQYNYITDELAKKSRIYKDNDVISNKWKANNSHEIINLELDE